MTWRFRRLHVFAITFTGFAALLLARSHELFSRVIYEEGDLAANSIITMQAKHFDLLVGNYSRLGFSHPGPAVFYVQAFGEWLWHDVAGLVPSPWNGQAVAILLLNAAVLAVAVTVITGWFRSWQAVAVCGGVLLLFVALSRFLLGGGDHPGPVSSTWMPDVYFAPFLLLLVAAASVAAGAARDLWALALAGGLLIHGHAEFLFFVPILAGVALIALVVPHRRALMSWLRAERKHWFGFAAVLGLFLVPILLNLVLHWPGEFGKYFAYGGGNEPNSVTAAARYAMRFWAVPAELGAVVAAATVAVVVLAAVKLGNGLLRFGIGSAALASALFLVYSVIGIDNLDETYIGRFYRAVPLFLLMLAGLGLLGLLRRGKSVAAVGVLAGGLLAGLISPSLVNRRLEVPDVPVALDAVTVQLAPAEVAVIELAQGDAWAEAVPLMVTGARQGVRLCLADARYAYIVTEVFVCTPTELADGRRFVISRREHLPAGVPTLAPLGRSDVLLP